MGTHNVQKHVIKHALIKTSECTIFYKKLQCLLKCQKKANLSAKCVRTKVSKTPDTSSIQLKKKKKKKNVHYRSSVFVKRFGHCHQFQ